MSTSVIPQYPWHDGDHLFASALNAAIANGPYLNNAGFANVLDFGADPSGAADSTTAFRNALASGQNVYAPKGTYLIRGQLVVGSQSLRGVGPGSTILKVDGTFDPTVTTGVIVVGATAQWPEISDLAIQFVQPADLSKTSVAVSAAGTNTVQVNSATGVVLGMSVVDLTARPNAIPAPVYGTEATATTVTNISGNTLTLNRPLTSPGVQIGDVLQFASTRSLFKTLAAGGSTAPGGAGIQYPWAIYSLVGLRINKILIGYAWNGIYIRGSSFQTDKTDVFAYNIGMDIDQCYNFPSVTDYMFYTFGESATGGPRDALTNVYYDGVTIAANFGETDGVGVHNFQSWVGIVNLTTAWTWGSFTNLMLDGSNSNLNILSTNGAGFAQITNCYSTKGSISAFGNPVHINANATFRVVFVNFSLVNASAYQRGILVQNGRVTIDDGYLWYGQQFVGSMIEVDGGSLYLSNVQFDAVAGMTQTYINMANTAAIQITDCEFVQPPGTGAFGLNVGPNNPVVLDNVSWNGWKASLPGNRGNNANAFVAPLDNTSIQSGALSFGGLAATQHFCTGYGFGALATLPDSAINTTAIGSLAGFNTRGSGNTFLGATSGYQAASGANNTCIGAVTGYDLTTGANNTLIGYNVGSTITTGTGNLHIAAGGSGLAYTPTESHTLRIGDNAINVLRATAIDTAAPKLFLDWLPGSTPYANDVAAAAGGVQIGQLYRTAASAVMVRVA